VNRRLITRYTNGNGPLCEADLSSNLDLAQVPDPDLIVRTGGEQRISNFLV
jgi:undecaprenyl diphosphate synthase